MIRHIVFEIRPYPYLQDNDRSRIFAVNVKTENNSYGFSEVIQVDEFESVFDHIMKYAADRLKEIIKNDRKKITPNRG